MARVYDLEPFLGPDMLGCDKARISIEAVCISHDKLIVTTNESFGYSFRLSPGLFEEVLDFFQPYLKKRRTTKITDSRPFETAQANWQVGGR